MSLKEKLDKIFDVSSYGYVVNKWILRSAFFIMLLLFLVVVKLDGFDFAVHGSQYVECREVVGCVNPFVEPVCDLFGNCEPSMMLGGSSWGVKPSLLARLFPYLCVGLFALSLLLNHLIYNKKFWSVKKNEK